ncbi:MAG TPA: SCO family protein [Bacteroidota bacterium]|nr:SCO family protein [Bacteroidota bacterium]
MTRPAALLAAAAIACRVASAQIPIQKVYDKVGIEQNLGAQLPLGLRFRDEEGRPVALGDFFGSRPVVLSLVYYRCPMLCTEVLNGMVECFRALPFSAGNEFTVVTVSIDPRETPDLAKEKKEGYLAAYGREGAAGGWHFLTGDAQDVAALAKATGFHYLFDSTSGQFAHAAGIMVATPGGRLSRYFYGVEYEPRDVRLALVEASRARIGSMVDRILLLCYHYDPLTGRYGPVIMNIFRGAGALTILVLGGGILILLRRERRKAAGAAGHAS